MPFILVYILIIYDLKSDNLLALLLYPHLFMCELVDYSGQREHSRPKREAGVQGPDRLQYRLMAEERARFENDSF